MLGVEAGRVADAALVVAEHDVAERRVEVDEQVVAVAAAGLRAVDDRERRVAPGRHRARHLADDPDALALGTRRSPRAGLRSACPFARPIVSFVPVHDDRPAHRPLDEIRGPEREAVRAGRPELAEVARARVGVEQPAVVGDGEADDAAVRHPVGAVEREQRARLVGGGRRGHRDERDGDPAASLTCRPAARAPALPSGSPPSRSPCHRAASGTGRARSSGRPSARSPRASRGAARCESRRASIIRRTAPGGKCSPKKTRSSNELRSTAGEGCSSPSRSARRPAGVTRYSVLSGRLSCSTRRALSSPRSTSFGRSA